jgi:hypothetical protein
MRETYPPGSVKGQLQLQPLPTKITLTAAQKLGPAGKPGKVLVAVCGDLARALWVDLSEHRRIAVVGAARSGRTTAALTIARSYADNQGRVALTAARLTDRHRQLAAFGMTVLVADEAAQLTPGAVDLVVVDDADQLASESWLGTLAAEAACALVVTTGWEAGGLNRPVPGIVKTASLRLVLRPDRTALRTGNSLGIAIPQEIRHGGPPGRACLLIDGEAFLGQVPL